MSSHAPMHPRLIGTLTANVFVMRIQSATGLGPGDVSATSRARERRQMLKPSGGRWIWAIGLTTLVVLATPAGAGDGVLDSGFGSGGKVTTDIGSEWDAAFEVAVQPDGKVVAVGQNHWYWRDSRADFVIARYNDDGSLDQAFGSGGLAFTDFSADPLAADAHDRAKAVALQKVRTALKIVAAGDGGRQFALARYNADGSLDATFGNAGRVTTWFGSNDQAEALAVQADGKIVAAGSSGGLHFALARYQIDGSLDPTFGDGGRVLTPASPVAYGGAAVYGVLIQPDGKIVVGGTDGDGWALLRYLPTGTLDPSFGIGGVVLTEFTDAWDSANAIAFDAQGWILAAGSSGGHVGTGFADIALARYTPDGAIDTSFGNDGKVIIDGNLEEAWGLVAQPDGKIVVAGDHGTVTRLLPAGDIDPSFGTAGSIVVADHHFYHLAQQQDGKLVAVGTAWFPDRRYDFGLARFTAGSTLSAISLSASPVTSRAGSRVELRWTGAFSSKVEIYRNGTLLLTTNNDGSHTDNLGRNASGTYVYKVCEPAGGVCSSDETVVL